VLACAFLVALFVFFFLQHNIANDGNQLQDGAPIQVSDDAGPSVYPHATQSIPIQRILESFKVKWNFDLNQPVTSSTTQEREQQQQQQQRRDEDIKKTDDIQEVNGIDKYPMKQSPHGLAVIINNSQFQSTDSTNRVLPNRRGSQIDENNLRLIWEFLNYDVRIFKNLTKSEITKNLMQISCENHANYDSFVCCILSHGHLDGAYGADGKLVNINDVADIFKESYCPTLVDKPKLFFIQLNHTKNEQPEVEDVLGHALLKRPDYLFSYVTAPCSVSYNDHRRGSWYISILRDVLSQHAKEKDLLEMLSIVNQRLSEAYNTRGYKQCPSPVTQLSKQVWFFGNSDA